MGLFDNLLKALNPAPSLGAWGATKLFGGGSNSGGPGVVSASPPTVPGNQGGPLNPNAPFQLPLITPRDPMKEYLEQLLRGLNSGGPDIMSLAEMREKATRQAGSQFDPQISALLSEQGATKSRAGRNKRDITSLYGSLADTYSGQAKESKAATKQAKKAEADAYKQLQKQVSKQYADQMASQAKELKNLGIEAALPEATKGQKEDLQFLNSLNATETGSQQRALDSLGLADANYYTQGAGTARLEGAENVSDLMNRLEDYLRESGSQIAGLRGQRASAIEQLINQMQSGQEQNQSQFENTKWNRLLQLAQFQNQLAQQSAKAMAPGEVPSKGLEGAYGVLNQSLGGNSQKTISALMNLLQTQPFREGRFEAGNKQVVSMTPENAAYQARQYASQQGLSAAETDALIKAVYAYYGKLR